MIFFHRKSSVTVTDIKSGEWWIKLARWLKLNPKVMVCDPNHIKDRKILIQWVEDEENQPYDFSTQKFRAYHLKFTGSEEEIMELRLRFL